MEWNTSLHINFIDFKKAFDSVHRANLWNILELGTLELPSQIIAIIIKFYKHFECSVILSLKSLSEPFPAESGVRQGCILFPILFLVSIACIMRNRTSDKPRGLQWTLLANLERPWLCRWHSAIVKQFQPSTRENLKIAEVWQMGWPAYQKDQDKGDTQLESTRSLSHGNSEKPGDDLHLFRKQH